MEGGNFRYTIWVFGVFNPFSPNKHRHGGGFFRFENEPSKLIPYLRGFNG